MKAMVVGVDGGIGEALACALVQRGDGVVGTTRRRKGVTESVRYLDLNDPGSADANWPAADVAFFCAAVARFAECRAQPEMARRVNVTMPQAIAARLVGQGTRVVYLSTSAVFDCLAPRMKADRPRAATSAYGRLKGEGEMALLALGQSVSVLRLTKVLTPGGRLFAAWIGALANGGTIRAFSDLRFSPLALEDVVQALLTIADHKEGGIFQVSGASDIAYADAALYFARRLGVPDRFVDVCSAVDHGIPAEEITAYTSLDTDRLSALCGFVPPDPWRIVDAAIEPLIASARRPVLSA